MQISADTFIKGNFSQVGKSLDELLDGSLHHGPGCQPLVPEGLLPLVALEDDGDDLPVSPGDCLRQTVLPVEVESPERGAGLDEAGNHGVVAVLSGEVKGRVPGPVLRAQAGPGLDQEVDTFSPAVSSGAAQRSPEVNILSLHRGRYFSIVSIPSWVSPNKG